MRVQRLLINYLQVREFLLKNILHFFNNLIVYYMQYHNKMLIVIFAPFRVQTMHKTKGKKQMQITDIKIRKFFEEGPMKAVVSVTFNDCLAVHDIKVIYARDRYFIVMPSRKNPDGTYRDIVHPINSDFRAELEEAVIEAYHVQLVAAEHDERESDDTYVI